MLLVEFSPDNPRGRIESCDDRDVSLVHVPRLNGLVIVRDDGSALIVNSKQMIQFDDGRRITSVTSSGVFLLDDGNIFEISNSLSILHRPVAPSVKVAAVASTASFTICVSSENQLFTWGFSPNGCLGLGSQVKQVHAPSFSTSFPARVKAVACSDTHALAATDVGVYAWGHPNSDDDIIWEPRKIDEANDVSLIAAGVYQSIWVTSGAASTVHIEGRTCTDIDSDSGIIKLISQGSSSAALSSSGSILTWGALPFVEASSEYIPIDICITSDSAIFALARLSDPVTFSEHVKRGFRPANLPAKSSKEAAKHQIAVARVLEASRVTKEDELLAYKEDQYLHDWWEDSLKHFDERIGLTEVMFTAWRTNGLSEPARVVLWPLALGNRFHISRENYEMYKATNHNEYSLVNLDMPRTFPELNILDPDSPFTRECELLLKAYHTFAPDMGYVQGMSFVAVTLLMHLPSYQAFVAFCELMHLPVLRILYRIVPDDMKMIFTLLDDYIDLNCPKVLVQMKKVGFARELFLLDWYLTLFSKCLDLESAVSVWDIIVLEGQQAIFQIATGILISIERQIASQEFDGCVAVIQRAPKKLNRRQLLATIRNVQHPLHAEQFLSHLKT